MAFAAYAQVFSALTPKRGRPSTLFLVSANGVVRNAYAYNVQASLAMDDLFKG